MGGRTTLALLLLAAGLAVFLWMEEPPPAEVPEDPPNLLGEPRLRDPSKFVPLLQFDPADVVALRLRHDDVDVSARRTEDGWSPPLDAARVDDFLHSMTEMGRVMEFSPADGALKDYGLDLPATVLELSVRHRETPLILEVGNQNPAATGVYVRVDRDGPIILGGALITWEIDKLLRPDSE